MCCTPPSATYKSHVFNYPASTGRITNVHAMENIRRLFLHVHRVKLVPPLAVSIAPIRIRVSYAKERWVPHDGGHRVSAVKRTRQPIRKRFVSFGGFYVASGDSVVIDSAG